MTVKTPDRQNEVDPERDLYKHQKVAQLARWRADITTMENQLLKADTGVTVNNDDELTKLKSALRETEKRLTNFDVTFDETWEEMKTYVDDAWHHLSASFDNMQAKLAEEMAGKGVQDVTNR